MMADLQQQRDGELTDGRRAVGRDVDDGNALFPGAGAVDHVIARRQHGDELDVRAFVHRRARDGRFVHHHDLRVADALSDQRGFGIGRAVVDRQLAEFFQLIPAQIAGILGIAVQNNNFHGKLSPRFKNIFRIYDFSSSSAQARCSTRLVLATTTSASSPGRGVTSIERI